MIYLLGKGSIGVSMSLQGVWANNSDTQIPYMLISVSQLMSTSRLSICVQDVRTRTSPRATSPLPRYILEISPLQPRSSFEAKVMK